MRAQRYYPSPSIDLFGNTSFLTVRGWILCPPYLANGVNSASDLTAGT